MTISIDTLKEAIQIKEQIATLEARIEKLLGSGTVATVASPASSVEAPTQRRKMSAAAKAKIAAAARARWARVKGTPAPVAQPVKKKGGISPEGRARIVAALKKRWAAVRKNKNK